MEKGLSGQTMTGAPTIKSFNRIAEVRAALNDYFVAEQNPFIYAINAQKRIEAFSKMEENIRVAAAELSDATGVSDTVADQSVNNAVMLHSLFNRYAHPAEREKAMNDSYMEALGHAWEGLRALESAAPGASGEKSMKDLDVLLTVTRAIIRTCQKQQQNAPSLAVA